MPSPLYVRPGRGFPAPYERPPYVPPATGGISWVSTGVNTDSGTSPATQAVDINGNCILIAATLETQTTATSIAATVGGQSAVLQYNASNFWNYSNAYFGSLAVLALQSPPQGAQDVAVTVTGGAGYTLIKTNCVIYDGVGSLGTPVHSTGQGKALSVSTNSGALVFNAFATWQLNGNGNISGYSGQQRGTTDTYNVTGLLYGDGPQGTATAISGDSNPYFAAIGVPLNA